ncbi:hypothetical protein AB0I66_21460 [Streptomyces sp. NPDC050439]|uniref:hypothetical protein n=1 Tax=unclassified Streptomyces TaxID=2593676 RepID=UPI0034269CB7
MADHRPKWLKTKAEQDQDRLLAAVTTPIPPAPAETDEERADREETEREHARGKHTYCDITCEVEFTTEKLRNTVLYRAIPGSESMLDELLRRASTEAAVPSAPADEAARLDAYAAAMARRDGHNWPPMYEDDERDYRRRADAAMAVAQTERAAEVAHLRSLLTAENQRANEAVDREETAEQAVEEARSNRLAVLREAADIAERLMDERYGPDCSYAIGGGDVARELRRMADEAQQGGQS